MERFLNQELLKEELSRKQFLRYVLGLVVALIGISNLIANLQKWKSTTNVQRTAQPLTKPKGFGTSKFGV